MTRLQGFKFLTTLVLVFKKIESKDKTKYENFYSSSEAEIIIDESDIDNVFLLQLWKTYKNFRKKFRLSKCNSLAGNSYIKLPKELDHPRKGLINI